MALGNSIVAHLTHVSLLADELKFNIRSRAFVSKTGPHISGQLPPRNQSGWTFSRRQTQRYKHRIEVLAFADRQAQGEQPCASLRMLLGRLLWANLVGTEVMLLRRPKQLTHGSPFRPLVGVSDSEVMLSYEYLECRILANTVFSLNTTCQHFILRCGRQLRNSGPEFSWLY